MNWDIDMCKDHTEFLYDLCVQDVSKCWFGYCGHLDYVTMCLIGSEAPTVSESEESVTYSEP